MSKIIFLFHSIQSNYNKFKMNNKDYKQSSLPQFAKIPRLYFTNPKKPTMTVEQLKQIGLSKINSRVEQVKQVYANFQEKRQENSLTIANHKFIRLMHQKQQLAQALMQLQNYKKTYTQYCLMQEQHSQELKYITQELHIVEQKVMENKTIQGMKHYQLEIATKKYQKMLYNVQQMKRKIRELHQLQQKQDFKSKVAQKKINLLNSQIDDLELQVNQHRGLKKIYNNQLQSTKGNIRVYCRIRPLLNIKQGNLIDYYTTDASLKIIVPKSQLKSKNNQSQYVYTFEQIFDRSTTQNQIFQEMTQLIQSSLSGKNVCILAYGQTGSGKTYTMQGNGTMDIFEEDNQQGIVQRSIRQIFQEAQKNYEDYQKKFFVSAIQIYNNQVRDLFDSSKDNVIKGGNSSEAKHTQITSINEGLSKFCTVTSNRIVRSTNANQKSSRSHLIFSIHLQFKHQIKKKIEGTLTFVDLAGSQRINDSNVTGQRSRQAKEINSSLTFLKIMLKEMKNKNSHIPFRNCKLTEILQNYLAKDSIAVMFVNLSSNQNDLPQSINSLAFATQVKNTKLDK